jgi:hypothetical protein
MEAIYDVIIGASTLRQLGSASVNFGPKQRAGRTSGGLDPSELYLVTGDPKATFQTMALGTALTAMGVTAGLFVNNGTITIPYAKRANGATYGGDGTNARINATHGHAVITSISGSQDDDGAVCECELYFLSSDGFVVPQTVTLSQNLASTSFVAEYAMGLGAINGTSVSQLRSLRVNTGLTVESRRYGGANYPTKCYVKQRDPSIEFGFEDMDALNTFTASVGTATSAKAWFRKRSDGGTYVSDASSVHIGLTFGAGLVTAQQVSAQGNENASATLTVYGKALSISNGAAIAV